MSLLSCVLHILDRYALVERPGVVAISGGPDSVALAHACATLWQESRLAPITLAHLNHQLRGADSDSDEEFVRRLPAAWNWPTIVVRTHRMDVALLAKETGDNLENAARQARYGWLTDIARQTGAAWIATGHTADDQAETVLHHLIRGSGLRGLAGMPWQRTLAPGIELVRPLLAVRRAAILEYVHARGLAFCRDASNDDPAFTRNRLRRDVLPMLEREFNPSLVQVLGRTAAQLREIQDELSERARALLTAAERPRAGDITVLFRPALEAAGPMLIRELLRLIWQREGWPLGAMGFDDWERATALACGTTLGNDFPGGVHVRTVGKVVQLERRQDSNPANRNEMD